MRRHIEGIIDSAIAPVLEEEYEIIVAHRMYTPGSINKQVIMSIYESELVIANLTGLNPNVMYELAFRHAIRKPVITIMESGDQKLPFDVVTERTIFYVNDARGVIDLRANLKKQIDKISCIKTEEIDNPIFSALEKTLSEKAILGKINTVEPIQTNAMEYILNRLDRIESAVKNNRNSSNFYEEFKRYAEISNSINQVEIKLVDNFCFQQLDFVAKEIISKLYLNKSIKEILKIWTENNTIKVKVKYDGSIKGLELTVERAISEVLNIMGLSEDMREVKIKIT
ncbi:hypothetical protein EHE19_019220 [Ruminiclostridium herbifermentans]|uniref:Uncharacterized protein n=1 Tax=Ruminiclostridium herbifermentans TaxID=2488810 RepID=A0A4U7J9G5_9FIRM|nr:hypothetical protein [Ruminiclostridium herbifermentans]QNU66927.1 hypothetical protein EHE19_019220 [Ruminiclostridium herbifermentans]